MSKGPEGIERIREIVKKLEKKTKGLGSRYRSLFFSPRRDHRGAYATFEKEKPECPKESNESEK